MKITLICNVIAQPPNKLLSIHNLNCLFMKRFLTLLALVFALLAGTSAQTQAQDYKTAIGLRFGYQYGLSVKHFFKPPWAFEILASTRGGGSRWNGHFGGTLTCLFEHHWELGKGFSWYAGGGLHISRWHSRHYNNGNRSRWTDDGYHVVVGLDGVLGIEYKFNGAPIALALDWKPEFDLVGGWWFGGDGLALTLRFCF